MRRSHRNHLHPQQATAPSLQGGQGVGLTQLHSCRSCAFCSWKEQYCAAKEMDMGRQYMYAQKPCRDYVRAGEVF